MDKIAEELVKLAKDLISRKEMYYGKDVRIFKDLFRINL